MDGPSSEAIGLGTAAPAAETARPARRQPMGGARNLMMSPGMAGYTATVGRLSCCQSCHPVRPPDRLSSFGEVEPHRPVALRVVEPFLANFHMQEEMHGGAMGFGNVLTRRRADRLDRSSALAEHDLAVALAADKDRLLDAG